MLILMLFIIGVALGGLTVIFAMQNIDAVTVSFFSWRLEGSLSLILMLATLMGVLITLLTIRRSPRCTSGHARGCCPRASLT